MIETIVRVDGMMCGMCEGHINDAIRSHFQVKKVSSSHTKGQTVIQSQEPLDREQLVRVINDTGYQAGEIVEFVHGLVERIKTTIVTEATPNTVVALMGVGSLFGLARVSSIVEGIKDTVGGRLVVFFPGEYHPENHAYRLLDARDGWNYLAVPLLAKEA